MVEKKCYFRLRNFPCVLSKADCWYRKKNCEYIGNKLLKRVLILMFDQKDCDSSKVEAGVLKT